MILQECDLDNKDRSHQFIERLECFTAEGAVDKPFFSTLASLR